MHKKLLLNVKSLLTIMLLPLLIHADDSRTFQTTPGHIEGLYYKAGSPKRNILLGKGIKGPRLRLKGHVLSTDGKPIPNVELDFWQADTEGHYDTKGMGLRGHQFTDKEGRYWLETIVPSSYLNRAPHIHVRLKLSKKHSLVTQLFFPKDPHNSEDPLFKESLVINVHDTDNGKEATFDFILDIHNE
jgi:protocatechuate 3,4-dioxygenase beta subunit